MKRMIVWGLTLSLLLFTRPAKAQTQEVEQLLLNVEKLAQMKQILAQAKQGYEVVAKGYLAVKNVSEGNFDLHKLFLDGLLEVSPIVRNYYKVAQIVQTQVRLLKSCKALMSQVKPAGLLANGELDYCSRVIDNLLKGSLRQIESLTMVISTGTLRMSDEERLSAIDKLWEESQEQQTFFRSFSAEAKVLLLQRYKERHDNAATRSLLGK